MVPRLVHSAPSYAEQVPMIPMLLSYAALCIYITLIYRGAPDSLRYGYCCCRHCCCSSYHRLLVKLSRYAQNASDRETAALLFETERNLLTGHETILETTRHEIINHDVRASRKIS